MTITHRRRFKLRASPRALLADRARERKYPYCLHFDRDTSASGFGEQQQAIISAPLSVLFLMLMFPLVLYIPLHLLLGRIFGLSPS